MLMEQLLCIMTTVVSLGENPICKKKGILARRKSFEVIYATFWCMMISYSMSLQITLITLPLHHGGHC
jgi:hypothetical protein